MNKKDIENRIRGALFGVAVGDALGGPLEFMDADAIQKQHGRVTDMKGRKFQLGAARPGLKNTQTEQPSQEGA